MKARRVSAYFLLLLVPLLNLSMCNYYCAISQPFSDDFDNASIFFQQLSFFSTSQQFNISKVSQIQQVPVSAKLKHIPKQDFDDVVRISSANSLRLAVLRDSIDMVKIFHSQEICFPFDYFT